MKKHLQTNNDYINELYKDRFLKTVKEVYSLEYLLMISNNVRCYLTKVNNLINAINFQVLDNKKIDIIYIYTLELKNIDLSVLQLNYMMELQKLVPNIRDFNISINRKGSIINIITKTNLTNFQADKILHINNLIYKSIKKVIPKQINTKKIIYDKESLVRVL